MRIANHETCKSCGRRRAGRPRVYDRQHVLELRAKGMSYAEIATELGTNVKYAAHLVNWAAREALPDKED